MALAGVAGFDGGQFGGGAAGVSIDPGPERFTNPNPWEAPQTVEQVQASVQAGIDAQNQPQDLSTLPIERLSGIKWDTHIRAGTMEARDGVMYDTRSGKALFRTR